MSRPGNAFIAVATLALGYFLSRGEFSFWIFLADALAFSFAIFFGNIHNDILDFETDKINRPTRPLPSGKVSVKVSKFIAVFFILLTLSFGFLKEVSLPLHLCFYTILLLILFAYNKWTKHVPLMKNLTVAFLCATPVIRAMLLQKAEISPLIFPLVFAFLYTLSREIQKDLEDVKGDEAAGILTFPIAVGENLACKFASFQVVLAWFLLPLPVLLNWYSPIFLLALLPLSPLSFWILLSLKKKDYTRARKITKMTMVAGLFSLVLLQIF